MRTSGPGTLVFSTEGATVVTEGGSRRDARSRAGARNGDGGDDAPEASPLDLPPTRRKRPDGELVN